MAARPFGVGSYKEAAARWLEWAGLWRAEELDAALRQALAADVALKSGGSDEAAIVTGLVLGFGARRQEAA